MHDQISLSGYVGTTPKHLVTAGGLPITSFRLGSTARRFDKGKNEWVDGETSWYTVTTFRQLARNVAASIEVGQPVVVFGRLRVRAWESDERHGITVEIDADSIGHDLAWGTTSFTKVVSGATISREEDTFSEIEAREATEAAEPRDAAPVRDEIPVPF